MDSLAIDKGFRSELLMSNCEVLISVFIANMINLKKVFTVYRRFKNNH